jgi:hypothetical protein
VGVNPRRVSHIGKTPHSAGMAGPQKEAGARLNAKQRRLLKRAASRGEDEPSQSRPPKVLPPVGDKVPVKAERSGMCCSVSTASGRPGFNTSWESWPPCGWMWGHGWIWNLPEA